MAAPYLDSVAKSAAHARTIVQRRARHSSWDLGWLSAAEALVLQASSGARDVCGFWKALEASWRKVSLNQAPSGWRKLGSAWQTVAWECGRVEGHERDGSFWGQAEEQAQEVGRDVDEVLEAAAAPAEGVGALLKSKVFWGVAGTAGTVGFINWLSGGLLGQFLFGRKP